MSGAYIMLFGMIFLGIMGAVNVVLFIGSQGTANAPPIYVRPDGCYDVVGKFRSARMATSGYGVILVPESVTADTEFISISLGLSADCPRVCMK